MEAKHTKGPWHVCHGEGQNGWYVTNGGGYSDAVAKIIDRGSPWSSREGQANSEANARLIAAAPALLAALEAIRDGMADDVAYRNAARAALALVAKP